MRRLLVAASLIGALALTAGALANESRLPKQSADDLKAVCTKAGGSFSQDANGYGCGTDCHGEPGTDCTVDCRAGERCTAQTIGARRPRSVEAALGLKPAHR